jgi:protein involved in polysaccharide export with SLBB domain
VVLWFVPSGALSDTVAYSAFKFLEKGVRILKKRLFPILALISLITAMYGPTQAQLVNPEKKTSVTTPAALETTPALEKSIDPAEYILGGGDELSLDVWGETSIHYSLSITPEGDLLIPGVGKVPVAGESLAEAKNTIQEAMLKYYKNVPITVTLVKLKKVKVIVAGRVESPGVYSVFANTRVSEVVDSAGVIEDSTSLRNIIVTHGDGSSITADIFKFERIGDRSGNPYVLGGDVLFVPSKEEHINTISIYGAVKSGGEFEYSAHDSLEDLINLAYGLTMDVDLLSGELVRFNPDHLTTTTIPLDLKGLIVEHDPRNNLPLLPDDRVFIRTIPKFHKIDQVYISGEVKYPGVYQIEEDTTKLSEVVTKAGGITTFASLPEAEMVRTYNVSDPEFERLKKIPVADMTASEYDYYKLRSREKPGRVACDFDKLFAKHLSQYDLTLKNGDVINIPTRSMVVNVSGSVINPGLVPYMPNENYRYYIERAGGYSWKARKDKVMIVKGQTGDRMKPTPGRRIDPGDTILIPEKPERDYWKLFRDTMLVLGNVATVYLVIQQATK